MRVGIALHESFSEVIDHFCQVANAAQNYFHVEKIELKSEEEGALEARDLSEDIDEDKICHKLFEIKRDRGYKPSDLFIAFFEGRLLDPKGQPYFLWTSDIGEERDPGVALISLNYLKSDSGILDSGEFALKSIEANLLYAMTVMSTSVEGHYETTGCLLDFCRSMEDINYSLQKGFVFCEQKRCKQRLRNSEPGQAALAIADGLNKHPIRLLSDIPLIPRCFKTGIGKCTKVKRVVLNQVFIGMPFRDRFEDVFNFAIKPVLDQTGYSCWKACMHGLK